MRILGVILLLISASLGIKHGWDAFQPANAGQLKLMADLGIHKPMVAILGTCSVLAGVMLFFPQTFFLANVLNAFAIVWIMALSLKAGNYKMAMIEIPFLALPLILIWLKYPFK